MNYFTKENLLSELEDYTQLVELKLSEDSSALISKYGGRILGVFPRRDTKNLLWVNPHIKEELVAKNWNIGGDRYWISPERDFFYKNPEHFEDWYCPEGLDPANYDIIGSSSSSCTVSTNILIVNNALKARYSGEITRQFTTIKEPIVTGVSYCGIEYIDDCVIYTPDVKANGWTLTQVISGGVNNPGTVLIPTNPDPKPLSYFRIIPKDRLKIGEKHVAYKIDVEDIYKLAIRPEDIDFTRRAKIGYVIKIPDSEAYGFLVKLSNDIPKSQDKCFDVSRDRPESEIGVIQSYNDESPNKPSLQFGEIELQLNSFETIANTSLSKAKHELLGYVGTKDEILDVVEKYLGLTNPSLF